MILINDSFISIKFLCGIIIFNSLMSKGVSYMTLEKHKLGYFIRVNSYAEMQRYRSLFSFFGFVFGSEEIVGVALNNKFSAMPIENVICEMKKMKELFDSFKS